jgi:hypothetical protein
MKERICNLHVLFVKLCLIYHHEDCISHHSTREVIVDPMALFQQSYHEGKWISFHTISIYAVKKLHLHLVHGHFHAHHVL